jgi:hypothetical protein
VVPTMAISCSPGKKPSLASVVGEEFFFFVFFFFSCPTARRTVRRASPSKVQGQCVVRREGCPALRCLSWRFGAPRSLDERPDCRDIWFPAPATTSAFRTGPCGVSPTAVRRKFSPAASSSRELPASFRVLRPTACPACPRKPCDRLEAVERLPWGSVPHRDVSWQHPHPPGNPLPSSGPSSTFRTSSTVYATTSLAGLFHPAATSRVCPSGDCPSRGAVPGFPGHVMPSCR